MVNVNDLYYTYCMNIIMGYIEYNNTISKVLHAKCAMGGGRTHEL